MNTKDIVVFIEAVDGINTFYPTETNLFVGYLDFNEWKKDIADKRIAFEACVLDCCAKYGETAAKSLSIYAEKLTDIHKRIKSQIDFLNSIDDERRRSKRYHTKFIYNRCINIEIGYATRCMNAMMKQYGISPTTSITEDVKKIEPVFYATNHTNKKLRRVYNYLIDNGHLEADTPLPDFLYYFTGKGKKVNDCLKWKSSKVGLAYFIDAIIVKGGTKDKQFWKKAETIFRESNLANKYSQSVKNKDNSQNEKIANDIKRLLKIK